MVAKKSSAAGKFKRNLRLKKETLKDLDSRSSVKGGAMALTTAPCAIPQKQNRTAYCTTPGSF